LAEIDQIWVELHDAEARLGRVEAELIELRSARRARSSTRQMLAWLIPTLFAGAEAVAIVLQTLHLA
jgi:hypothetical protein